MRSHEQGAKGERASNCLLNVVRSTDRPIDAEVDRRPLPDSFSTDAHRLAGWPVPKRGEVWEARMDVDADELRGTMALRKGELVVVAEMDGEVRRDLLD
jgi:hypothetical protein